jgi:uncharacterized protein (DUF2141 family)
MKSIFAVTLIAASLNSAFAKDLTVEIQNRKSKSSQILCGLFVHADGFPMDPSQGEKSIAAELTSEGKTFCTFKDIAGDEVAVSVLEDLNGNGKMDTSAVGLPKEPWGVSKNVAAHKFGPPKFSEAKIKLPGDLKIEIKLNH